MKKLFNLFGVFLIIISVFAGCTANTKTVERFTNLPKFYKDIPDITAQEKSDIEKLQDGRKLTYGVLFGTEAFLLDDGTYAGFTVNLCKYLSDMFGIEIDIKFYEWDALIAGLEAGEIDFTGELTPTDIRKASKDTLVGINEDGEEVYGKGYIMSVPIAERMLRVFNHEDVIHIHTEADLNGLNIAFLEDTTTADEIRKAYPINFTVTEVPDYPVAAQMIKDGEIDAFIDEAVADPAFDEYGFIHSQVFFSMVHAPVSMTTVNPELGAVISTLDKYLQAGGIDKLYELYQDGEFTYIKNKLHKSFTPEELDFLAEHEVIATAYEYDNYPVSFYNTTEKEFEGIAIDVLKDVTKLTGLRFESALDRGMSWADMLNGARNKNVHMFAELLHTKEREEHFIWSSVPYSSSYYIIMSKSDFLNLATYQITRYTVGIIGESAHEEIYRGLFPENNNIKLYDTFEACLDALENDEVDLLMASENMLLTQSNYREKPGYKINIKLNIPMDSFFGFHKDEVVLRSIIDKTQQYINTELIEISWTGRTFDYTKKVLEERARFLTTFTVAVCILLVGAGFLIFHVLKLDKQLKEIASHDALTGIYNRRFFMDVGKIYIERALRIGSNCFIIIYDLDHFKKVNDTYGHQAGDKVLKDTAARVKNSMRKYDILGRYGGEEFIILMTDVKKITKGSVINAVDRIRNDICNKPVEFEGIEIPVSASFGIAYSAPDENDMETAIKHADIALYTAKETGRNKAVFYEDII